MTLARFGPAPRALLVASLYFIAGIVNHFYSYGLVEPLWFYWLADFLEQVVFSVVLLLVIFRLSAWRLRDFGVSWPPGRARSWRLLGTMIAGIALLVLAAPLSETLAARLGVAPPPSHDEDAFLQALPEEGLFRFLVVLYGCAVSGVFEEVFYRGVLWRALVGEEHGIIRRLAYVLLSSALFGLAHTEQGLFGVVSNAIWGVACAVLLLMLRNLWPLMVGHAATNFVEYLPFLGVDGSAPDQP